MCAPTVFVRPDGKGFIVRKGGADWDIRSYRDAAYAGTYWTAENKGAKAWGHGPTIMEAVDAALAKLSKDKE